MPRIKYKKTLLTLLFGFFVLVIQQYNQAPHSGEDSHIPVAATAIIKAIGTRNTSSLVLPDESTTIVQPSLKSCQDFGSDVFALFMVISSPENKERRDIIRSTLAAYIEQKTVLFANQVEEKFKLFFFIGLSNKNVLDEEVNTESDLHGDIVVDNFQESYLNLTLKTLRMLKFFQETCREARYLVKIDDDVHLNVLNFIQFLQDVPEEESSSLIAGYKYNKISIDKNPSSKWYTPTDLWPQETLPDFTAGFFYVLGTDAVSKIYNASLYTPLFHLEDVFLTGMVGTMTLKMKIHHIPEIMTYWFPIYNLYTTSCTFQSYMAVHSANPNSMRCWSLFNSEKFECGRLTPIFFYC